jgi:DNA-binding MarR family transcriptional regulator
METVEIAIDSLHTVGVPRRGPDGDNPLPYVLDDHLPYLVNRVGMKAAALFTEETLAREGLSIEMWRVLSALSDAGSHRQVDLSARTSLDTSTISRLVSRLVHVGLATRTRSATSNREVVVALSPKGEALVRRLVPRALDLESSAVAGVPAKDVETLKRTLLRVFENLARNERKPR